VAWHLSHRGRCATSAGAGRSRPCSPAPIGHRRALLGPGDCVRHGASPWTGSSRQPCTGCRTPSWLAPPLPGLCARICARLEGWCAQHPHAHRRWHDTPGERASAVGAELRRRWCQARRVLPCCPSRTAYDTMTSAATASGPPPRLSIRGSPAGRAGRVRAQCTFGVDDEAWAPQGAEGRMHRLDVDAFSIRCDLTCPAAAHAPTLAIRTKGHRCDRLTTAVGIQWLASTACM